jgi:ribose 5-phosphate isomerase
VWFASTLGNAYRTEWVLVTRDGNQIVALIGQDLQVGIGGTGNTIAAALRNLADRMEAEKYPMPGIDF